MTVSSSSLPLFVFDCYYHCYYYTYITCHNGLKLSLDNKAEKEIWKCFGHLRQGQPQIGGRTWPGQWEEKQWKKWKGTMRFLLMIWSRLRKVVPITENLLQQKVAASEVTVTLFLLYHWCLVSVFHTSHYFIHVAIV